MILQGLNRRNKPIEVHIENGIITKVIEKAIDLSDIDACKDNSCDNYIIPGFIDIHTHGGYGTDFADNSEESTRKYLRNLAKEGTTSIVHATITTEYENLLSCIEVAKHVMDNPKDDEVRYLGVNIEGNFLNKAKKGAHKEELLVPLLKKHVEDLSANGAVKMISAAYENAEDGVIELMNKKGIIASLAHSIATGEQTQSFVDKGLKGITHMFNAMPAFNHRDDVSTNRALSNDDIYTEIIVDGIHVNREVINLLYKVKPINKILIITDSAPAKGMPDGDYKFGELDIYKDGDMIKTKLDNALAGSIANMHLCFKNFINYTNCTLEEASIATSTNQAEYLGIDDIGDIKVGYKADILILDKEYNIKQTISNGKVLWERK